MPTILNNLDRGVIRENLELEEVLVIAVFVAGEALLDVMECHFFAFYNLMLSPVYAEGTILFS